MRLKDKVAIITGGAHGMGEVEARLFAQEGAKVVVADVLAKEGEAVAADISAGQHTACFVQTDVTSETDWQRLLAAAIAAYGRLDILVNNAGISGSSVGDADRLDGWQRLLAVNATSVFLGTKLAANEMTKTGGGSIVNISSIMGIVASDESHPGYAASKAAVRNYTKAAACRYGPQGVRVELSAPRIYAADAERDECSGTGCKDCGHSAASVGQADRGGLWRSVPRIRRGVIRHRGRTGDRRRIHRPLIDDACATCAATKRVERGRRCLKQCSPPRKARACAALPA